MTITSTAAPQKPKGTKRVSLDSGRGEKKTKRRDSVDAPLLFLEGLEDDELDRSSLQQRSLPPLKKHPQPISTTPHDNSLLSTHLQASQSQRLHEGGGAFLIDPQETLPEQPHYDQMDPTSYSASIMLSPTLQPMESNFLQTSEFHPEPLDIFDQWAPGSIEQPEQRYKDTERALRPPTSWPSGRISQEQLNVQTALQQGDSGFNQNANTQNSLDDRLNSLRPPKLNVSSLG
jgi:hypothetical protein